MEQEEVIQIAMHTKALKCYTFTEELNLKSFIKTIKVHLSFDVH